MNFALCPDVSLDEWLYGRYENDERRTLHFALRPDASLEKWLYGRHGKSKFYCTFNKNCGMMNKMEVNIDEVCTRRKHEVYMWNDEHRS